MSPHLVFIPISIFNPQVVNYSDSRTVEDICENSTKLITLIDLCGHHKYLKTTIFGLTGYSPDFAMLVVSANTGMGEFLASITNSWPFKNYNSHLNMS